MCSKGLVPVILDRRCEGVAACETRVTCFSCCAGTNSVSFNFCLLLLHPPPRSPPLHLHETTRVMAPPSD